MVSRKKKVFRFWICRHAGDLGRNVRNVKAIESKGLNMSVVMSGKCQDDLDNVMISYINHTS